MRGRCPREGNFGDFTLKMAILSSFQAQGNRAAGMDIEIFGFPDSSDGLVCELFPAPTFWRRNFRKFSRKFASSDGKEFPESAQSKHGNSCQGQAAHGRRVRKTDAVLALSRFARGGLTRQLAGRLAHARRARGDG